MRSHATSGAAIIALEPGLRSHATSGVAVIASHPSATGALTPVRVGSTFAGVRTVASVVALTFALVTSQLSLACGCDVAMADAEAPTSCCPSAAAAIPDDATSLDAVCAHGCCERDVLYAAPAEQQRATVPGPELAEAPTLSSGAEVAFDRAGALAARLAPRGPPPDISTRLAMLQIWRC